MIVLDCEQGSGDWLQARLAIPTASRFKDIMTRPRSGDGLSKTAETYMNQLLAEFFIGEPCESASSPWMERGTDMEGKARCWYEFDRGVAVRQVGLILRDDRLVGCSPDGLVGTDGGLEIKCPSAKKHIEYARDPQRLADDYNHQIHGALYVTGLKWWDVLSYNPAMPPVLVRVTRDADYIDKLGEAIGAFVGRMLGLREDLIAKGFTPARKPGEYCTHPRDDGRFCFATTGLAETPDGWRCERHKEESR